jgi:RNA-directed DNA polymerase
MVLEAVYEQDYLPCSYGFRPGRSAHQALRTLRDPSGGRGSTGCWISIFVSISIPHAHLRRFLDQRVTDGVIRRTIDKWLKAGVVEDGHLHHTTAGSPQGGVISPCLSNVYLHYVLDKPKSGSWTFARPSGWGDFQPIAVVNRVAGVVVAEVGARAGSVAAPR